MTIQADHCIFLQERGCLIVAVQSALTDGEISELSDYVTKHIAQHKPRWAILDLGGLDVGDSFSVRNLQFICAMLHLYGVKTIIANIPPEIAITMSMRGLKLKNVLSANDLTDAMAMVESSLRFPAPKSAKRRGPPHSFRPGR